MSKSSPQYLVSWEKERGSWEASSPGSSSLTFAAGTPTEALRGFIALELKDEAARLSQGETLF